MFSSKGKGIDEKLDAPNLYDVWHSAVPAAVGNAGGADPSSGGAPVLHGVSANTKE